MPSDVRPKTGRRALLLGSAAVLAATSLPPSGFAAVAPSELRIGYQKSSILALVRQQGLVERRYGTATRVQWIEFPFGPPLLEAMNADRLDYGYTGNAPPVFAQAARANFLYVAVMPGHRDNVSILVPADSAVRTIADLKGRKVAVGKGSSGHAFLVAALDGAGVDYKTITPVYLAPADAAAAFSRGAVDAWSIWDPYLAITQTGRSVRALPIDDAVGRQSAFFLANRTFAERHPDIVKGLNEDVSTAALWARSHREEATLLYAKATGVAVEAERLAIARTLFTVAPMTDAVTHEQQTVADRFLKIGLIPHRVDVGQIVWR